MEKSKELKERMNVAIDKIDSKTYEGEADRLIMIITTVIGHLGSAVDIRHLNLEITDMSTGDDIGKAKSVYRDNDDGYDVIYVDAEEDITTIYELDVERLAPIAEYFVERLEKIAD